MTTKTDKYQIGMSATASNNFVLLPDGAGALEIKRGNLGAEGETVLKIDAGGNIVDPRVMVDVLSQRVADVWYLNDSGMELVIYAIVVTLNSTGRANIGLKDPSGATFRSVTIAQANTGNVCVSSSVPNGWSYQVNGVTPGQITSIGQWVEYRKQP